MQLSEWPAAAPLDPSQAASSDGVARAGASSRAVAAADPAVPGNGLRRPQTKSLQFEGQQLAACGAKGSPTPVRKNLLQGAVGPAAQSGGLQKIKPVSRLSTRARSAMAKRPHGIAGLADPTIPSPADERDPAAPPPPLRARPQSAMPVFGPCREAPARPRTGFPEDPGAAAEGQIRVEAAGAAAVPPVNVAAFCGGRLCGPPDPAVAAESSRFEQTGKRRDRSASSARGRADPQQRARPRSAYVSQPRAFVDACLPLPQKLSSHLPPHTRECPFGAASHGYYARKCLEEFELASRKLHRPSTAPSKASPSSTTRRPSNGGAVGGPRYSSAPGVPRNRELAAPHRSRSVEGRVSYDDGKASPYARDRNRAFTNRDVAELQESLAKLTDEDCRADDIRQTVMHLADSIAGKPDASAAFHDEGGVTIMIKLMDRFNDDPTVQVASCLLLQTVVGLTPDLVSNSIARQGGISKILDVVRKLSDGHGLARTAETASSAFLSGSMVSGIDIPGVQKAMEQIPSTFERRRRRSLTARTTPASPAVDTSLLSGLIDQYLEASFLDNLELMRRSERRRELTDLISVFSKVCRLLTASSYISLESDLSMATDRMIQDALSMVPCESLQLYLVDQETRELVSLERGVSLHEGEKSAPVKRYPLSRGIAGWVAEHGEVLKVPDVTHDQRFDREVDAPQQVASPANVLCVPIRTRTSVTKGVLEALNKLPPPQSAQLDEPEGDAEKQGFDEEDEILLRALAAQAGVIIQNSQTYETIIKTQKKVEVLLMTTRSLLSTLELDQLTQTIMNSARELLNADRCTLFLVDHDKEQLYTHIQGRNGVMQEVRLNMNTGIAGYVATSGESVNIKDAYQDPRFNRDVDKQTGYVTKGILCMPIKNTRGTIVGVTQMINSMRGTFSTEDEQLLGAFSAQAAVVIEQSHLFKKTEEMRAHLQSILSSITNCVITLSSRLMVTNMNHPWFVDAIGVESEETIYSLPLDQWIGERNQLLLNDVLKVFKYQQPVYSAEYELIGPNQSTIVNYNIVPLLDNSTGGVVIVLEDISAEKRAMMTLGRYMSPALAKQVMEEGGGELGGKRQKVTVLFSDIRSFTTFTERMEPHDVVELLNEHLSDAVDAILAESGILDKYIGDAVMAVFGIPFVSGADAIHACNTALRMRDSLAAANERRRERGEQELRIGIGINTGECLVGNIGNKQRMEYTVIGDHCNLASRTEGLTKYYAVQTLVTEYTLQETGDCFVVREIDRVIVVGRSHRVRIYELLGRRGDTLDSRVAAACAEYARGLELYRAREFAEAAAVFEENVRKNDDAPSRVLLDRCRAYVAQPPPPDWDGVHKAGSK